MDNFITIAAVIVLMLEELIRVSLLLKKANLRPRFRFTVGSSILILLVVLPTLISTAIWNEVLLILSILWLLIGICIDQMLYPEKAFKWKLWTISYLPLLIITIAFTLLQQNEIDKQFENQWMQTQEIVITKEPIHTTIAGYEKVIIENCNGEDIVITVTNDKLDILKLQKDDRIKHLKDRHQEKFEIITLRGEPYRK